MPEECGTLSFIGTFLFTVFFRCGLQPFRRGIEVFFQDYSAFVSFLQIWGFPFLVRAKVCGAPMARLQF